LRAAISGSTLRLAEPPSASLLYSVEVPPEGGDTWYANMHAAYDALPDQLRDHLDGLKVNISRPPMAT
jgi:taurine dioxygenase/putative 2-oxoglutarate oxygenase